MSGPSLDGAAAAKERDFRAVLGYIVATCGKELEFMNRVDTPATVVARLSTQEGPARRLADLLAETLAAGEAAVAAYEEPGGAWSVEIYFSEPPDEAALRALIAVVAGEADARALTLTSVAAKDWVAASLAGTRSGAGRTFPRAWLP